MKKKKVSKKISSKKKSKKTITTVKQKSVTKKRIDKGEKEFPGYPHYPSSNDIMNPKNKIVREEFKEALPKHVKTKSRWKNESAEEFMEQPVIPLGEETEEIVGDPETEVSSDEKQLLEADELSEDLGEDEELRTRVWAVDMTGKDLDVPGTELDDEAEEYGEEDEENNIYSIGGDRHEGLEEEHDRGK